MDGNTLYYYFSTCAQSAAAIVAVTATFLLFKLQSKKQLLEAILEKSWNFCTLWLHLAPNLKKEIFPIDSLFEKIQYIYLNMKNHSNDIERIQVQYARFRDKNMQHPEEIRDLSGYVKRQWAQVNQTKGDIDQIEADIRKSFFLGLCFIVISISGLLTPEFSDKFPYLKAMLMGMHIVLLLIYAGYIWRIVARQT